MGLFGKSPAKEGHEKTVISFTIDRFRKALFDLSPEDKNKITVEDFLTQQDIPVDDFQKVKDPEAVIPRIIQNMIKLDKHERTMTVAQFIDQLPKDLREAL